MTEASVRFSAPTSAPGVPRTGEHRRRRDIGAGGEGLQQCVALITGGNKGIGLQIARQLAGAGLQVVIGSRDAARGAKAVAQLAADGLMATTLPLDLDAPETHAAAAEHLRAEYGHLDVPVNNAGIFDFGDAVPSCWQPLANGHGLPSAGDQYGIAAFPPLPFAALCKDAFQP